MLSLPFRILIAGLFAMLCFTAAIVIVFQARPQYEIATSILFVCFFCTTFLLMLRALEPLQALPTIFCMFYFSFFYLLPGLVQVSSNTFQMADVLYSDPVATRAALVTAGFLLCFFVGQQLVGRQRYDDAVAMIRKSEESSRIVAITLFCLTAIVLGLLCIKRFGFSVLLSTRGEFKSNILDTIGLSQIQIGLLLSLPRCLVLVGLLLAIYAVSRWRHERPAINALIGIPLVAALTPIFLVVNYLPALARNWQFGILLSFLIVFLKSWRPWIRVGLVVGMLLAMFSLFQWLNVLRHYDSSSSSLEENIQDPITYLKQMDFDGFQTTMNTVKHTDMYGYTYGNQLLSSILFFVPRSIWKGKGEGTGIMVGRDLGYSMTNLSTPLPAEFYIDFSYAGAWLGGLFVGYLYRRMDYVCAAGIDYGKMNLYLIMVAIATSYTIYGMRGTLLALVNAFGPMAILVFLVLKSPVLARYLFGDKSASSERPPLQAR